MTKDEAIEILEWQKEYQYESDVEAFDMAIEALKTEPVRHGMWNETNFLKVRECSCCHAQWGIYSIEEFDYCPTCGAKMDEVKEE